MTAEHHDGHGGEHDDHVEVSADALGGTNATGGYGDESTGLSDEATADEAPTEGTDADPELSDDTPLLDRSPGEDAVDPRGGNADR